MPQNLTENRQEKGYDTEGERYEPEDRDTDAFEEEIGAVDFEEEIGPVDQASNPPTPVDPSPDPTPAPQPSGSDSELTENNILNMNVTQLRTHIQARGHSLSDPVTKRPGNKQWLQQTLIRIRLQGVTVTGAVADTVGTAPKSKSKDAWMPPGAKWIPVEADEAPVSLDIDNPVGLSVKGAVNPANCRNFSDLNVDRATQFTGNQEKTGPNSHWLKEHRLTKASHPVDFVDAFLPIEARRGSRGTRQGGFSWTKMAEWTNLKALLAGAGAGGVVYPSWQPTGPHELRRLYGLYLLTALSPSPNILTKFNPQSKDPINGSDIVSSAFGVNGKRRYRELKCFLSVQDPRVTPPRKEVDPNFKVSPLLRHVELVSRAAVEVGRMGSGDEQDEGFQGQSEYKIKIKFKDEGDGFLVDVICLDAGYTYSFHWRHVPATPIPELAKYKLSPLHQRCAYLLTTLPYMWHEVWWDNLYTSTKFLMVGQHLKQHIAGVCRKGGRGFPESCKQEEVAGDTAIDAVRGTVKVAVLRCDAEPVDFVAVSVYDNKPVYFLSSIAKTIEWVMKERRVQGCVQRRS